MDGAYIGQKPRKNWLGIIVIVIFIIIISSGVYLWLVGKSKVISPIPEEPSFEMIFYTPTPAESELTSSPSATPKDEGTPKPTAKPTAKPTVKPTVEKEEAPTPTEKPTPTE